MLKQKERKQDFYFLFYSFFLYDDKLNLMEQSHVGN